MRHRVKQGLAPCLCVFWALLAAPRAGAHGVWTDVPSPAPRSLLHAVEFASRVEAWAVGDTGTILHLKRGTWVNYTSGTDQALLGLAVLSATDAWAVGLNGTLMRFDGAVWTPHADSGKATLLPLRTVAFLNPDNGWAVGGRAPGVAPGEGVVLRYDGARWTSATRTADPLYDLALMASDNIRFCGGNRRIMKFDGNAFTLEPGPVADGRAWRALAFPFASRGWAFGEGGTIARFAAGTWVAAPSPVTEDLLGAAVLASPDMGYVVGANGTRLHLRDGVFEHEASGGETLAAVALANEQDGVAVGGTTLPRLLQFRALTERTDLNAVRTYPNPYDPGTGRPFTLDRLPADVTALRLLTLNGEVIAELAGGVAYLAASGVATWDGRLAGGGLAASGAYVYELVSAAGGRRRGVFLVARR